MSKDFVLNLNNIDWDIKYVADKNDALDGCQGMCYYKTSTIYISKTLKDSVKLYTLFHELSHAILAETDYNEEIREALGDNYEKFITLLGARICDICKQFSQLEHSI